MNDIFLREYEGYWLNCWFKDNKLYTYDNKIDSIIILTY